MLSALQFLFSFYGRLNRFAFLLFYLAGVAYAAAVSFLLQVSLGNDQPPPIAVILALFPGMAAVYSAMVRRLHDRNRSSWWLALFFLPAPSVMLLGHLLWEVGNVTPEQLTAVITPLFTVASIPLIWGGVEILFLPGTSGPNRFGVLASGETANF